MPMERVQIMLRPDQRRSLEALAAQRGSNVSALIRAAIDRQYQVPDRATKERALDRLLAGDLRAVGVDEMEDLLERRFAEEHERIDAGTAEA